jgi:hypothetical protein
LLLPGEVCAERLERGNHGHIMKAVLNAQKSAEAIVPGGKKKHPERAEPTQARVGEGRRMA